MEQRIIQANDGGKENGELCFKQGFMLVTVVIITAVGLLLGAGALLMFRNQCQLRIERQHEFEKVYAVRSVLNFLRTYTGEISDEGLAFTYYTPSERSLKLIARPVEPIFPTTNINHFVMDKGHFSLDVEDQYIDKYDCEYGAIGVTNLHIKNSANNKYPIEPEKNGLFFTDVYATNSIMTTATNRVKWWVNICMSGTGSWLQEDYGRRYSFLPKEYVEGEKETADIMRLCIIRNVSNDLAKVGFKHGWPLSRAGERALVFEIVPMAGEEAKKNNAEMRFLEYVGKGGGDVEIIPRLILPNSPSLARVGIQIAQDKVSLFYVGNANENDKNVSLSSKAYFISQTVQMTPESYEYFAKEVKLDGEKLCAPDLRAVFEIEAASDKRKPGAVIDSNANENSLTEFRVTPAYQFDIYVEHPEDNMELATVAQKIGEWQRSATDYTILTYDTHGTENKGFRKDEKLKREQGR